MNTFNQRLLSLLVLCLLGCAAPSLDMHHVVLGSGSYGYPASNVRVVSAVQGDDFEIRHSQVKFPECASGSLDMLEFSGSINNQSLQIMNNLMHSVTPCIRRDGRRVVNPIYMNSAEGELLLGTQLGQLFQHKGVEVIVTEGQVCESACAVAYLGAQRKRVQSNGRVVLHLAGEQGKGFDCARSIDMMPFKNYLFSTAGKQSGQALFNQALGYCRNGKGWDLS